MLQILERGRPACRSQLNLLFHPFCPSGVSETFGEGIVVDLQLGDFLVLICGYCDELALFEHVRSERRIGKLKDVAGANQVKTRLVLVHRVEDSLQQNNSNDKLELFFLRSA